MDARDSNSTHCPQSDVGLENAPPFASFFLVMSDRGVDCGVETGCSQSGDVGSAGSCGGTDHVSQAAGGWRQAAQIDWTTAENCGDGQILMGI